MNNTINNKQHETNIDFYKLIDIVNSFSNNLTEIANNRNTNKDSNNNTTQKNNGTIMPLFELQSSLSDYEKQKRSNFIKEQIKITAIKGDIVEETMDDFVFISYKSGDWEEIYKKYIAPLHKKYGLNIYCDAAFDDGNENWTIQMEKHITSKKCKAVLCFLSKGYLGSYATLIEVMANRFNEFFAKNKFYKPIIPIILDNHNDWEDLLGESKDLVGIPNSGPEYTMFIDLLKNFLIVIDFETQTINSMQKEFLKKSIKEMISDNNLNSSLTKSKTYEFIMNTIKLTNNPTYAFYDKTNPEQFFDELVKNIKSVVKDDSTIFTGSKNSNFNVNMFIKEDIKNEYSVSIKDNRFDYYIADNSSFSFPSNISKDDNLKKSDNIITIGEGAFERKILKNIIFDENCKVTTIEDDAFNNCKYLLKIELPKSTEYLGDTVFENCKSLTKFSLPNNIKEIGEGVFIGCTNLKNFRFSSDSKFTNIPNEVFKNCESLDNITLPHTVKSIGERVFMGCTNLKKFDISFNLKSIEKSTFEGCKSLNNVYVPSSVYEIKENAFKDCIGLKEIYIHECVRKIEPNAFIGCWNLTTIEGIDLEHFNQEELELAFGDTLWFRNNYI